ncbi:hypothetical protein BGX31_001913 [Mortierella sp. GBA43]|nr:hypothetical protein BGX31_001913 [Mortierella sp. GBA43]
MSETHSQPFRAQKSTKIVTIPTRQDTKSGQRIVRWKDVQQCFENAKTIMNGEDIVLFLTDDDLEDLIPLRIAHHPGVVLEVVTQDGGQDELSARRGATSSNDRRAHENQALSTIRIGSMARDVDTLGISDIDDYHALVAHSRDHTLGTPIRRISSSMDVHQLSGQRFDQPLLEMDPTTALRNELQQLRNQTEQTQRQMKEVQHKMQQETKKGKCNLGIKILIVFLCFGVFHFFFSFSSQQSQQVADDVIRSAQQSDHQLHYSEQLLQQHIDEALQKMQLQEQMDGVLQKVNDAVKNLEQLTLQKQLLNDMMEEFKKSNTKSWTGTLSSFFSTVFWVGFLCAFGVQASSKVKKRVLNNNAVLK